MLGKRVVQELEVLRKVIRAIPRAQSQTPFIRPLSDAEADAIRAGMLPEYADADVVGIIDTDLRDPILPTRLARSSDAKGDADVIVFPLRLASHAPQAGALLRSIIAMEEQRAMAGDMRRAEEDMKDSVAARAAAEGVSKYEAGTETVADLKGTLPSEEVKASDRGVEIHREGEGARFVAIVVPNAASGVDELWRAAAVPFVISLIRVGLFNGFGWEETPVASK